MINITFINGTGLIFNTDDWFELRTKYRIIGEFFGVTRTSPTALPLALSPPETYLLVKNGFGKLVKWEQLRKPPTSAQKTIYAQEIKQLFEDQTSVYRENRKHLLENMIDKIYEAKIKDGLKVGSKADVLEEELAKSTSFKLDNMIIQVPTQHMHKGAYTEVPMTDILNYTTQLKCAVFEDLWNRNYYVTSGRKFGGDFLVYLGDPIQFHAIYIVKCTENRHEQFDGRQIIANGRFGNSVKKRFVLASFNDEQKVCYITIKWIDAGF